MNYLRENRLPGAIQKVNTVFSLRKRHILINKIKLIPIEDIQEDMSTYIKGPERAV